jgi:hypothetical protein
VLGADAEVLKDAWGLPVVPSLRDDDAIAQMVLPRLLEMKKMLNSAPIANPDAISGATSLLSDTIALLAPQETDRILSGLLMEKFTSRLIAKLLKVDLGIVCA